MLNVTDVRASVDWYTKLGFEVVRTDESADCPLRWASLRYGAADLMLNAGGSPEAGRRDVSLWFATDDVDALHAELAARVEVMGPPVDQWYGIREFGVRDPDGFELMFSQPLPDSG